MRPPKKPLMITLVLSNGKEIKFDNMVWNEYRLLERIKEKGLKVIKRKEERKVS